MVSDIEDGNNKKTLWTKIQQGSHPNIMISRIRGWIEQDLKRRLGYKQIAVHFFENSFQLKYQRCSFLGHELPNIFIEA
jgi:hypothetical protein